MTGPGRQRGAVTLIGALFIIVTLALMIEVMHRLTGSDVLDTALQNDSVEALFVVETGIENAAYRYANGTTCAGLVTAAPVNTGRGNFSITSAVLAGSDCQLRIAGRVPTLGAQRIVGATLTSDGNLLANANPNFNDPVSCPVPNTCIPTGWSLDPGAWRDDEGPDGTGDRAAYVEKPDTGPNEFTSAGSFGLTPFTVTGPTVLTLTFDYRVNTTGSSPKEAQIVFRLLSGATTFASTPTQFYSGHTGSYVSGSVTFSIPGTVTFTELEFDLIAKAGKPKQVWLDNLKLEDPAGGGVVALRQWQEIVTN